MPYDLFISYSRRDNERGQVTALKAQIESSFRAFAGRELPREIRFRQQDRGEGRLPWNAVYRESFLRLSHGASRVFFDTHEIAGMDDWRQKIQPREIKSCRERARGCSRYWTGLEQTILSPISRGEPHYLASPYCRWEWEDCVRYEAMRPFGVPRLRGRGTLFGVPRSHGPIVQASLAHPNRLKAGLQTPHRLKPELRLPDPAVSHPRVSHDAPKRKMVEQRSWIRLPETAALQQAPVRQTLEQLHASVRERLDGAERSRSSPNNLIKHNPAFVGRVRELTELRNALAKNKLGVVGARKGQMPGRATVQGLGGMGKTELALAYAHAFARSTIPSAMAGQGGLTKSSVVQTMVEDTDQ